MVARLAWLKLLLLWNGLRADWQRRIGFPLTVGALGAGAWWLSSNYSRIMGGLTTEAALEFSLWAALLFFMVWITLPVVIFPIDEHLDPAQFGLAPIPARTLVLGLAVAALVAPSVVIPAVVLGTNLVVFSQVWPAAVLAAVLMLALMVISSQLFTTLISAVLRTRRGRDLTSFIVVGIGLGGFSIQQLVRDSVERLGIEGAVLAHSLSTSSWLLPPVAVQRVVTEAAQGNPAGVVVWSLVSAVWIALLAYFWHRLLGWMLTTPADSPVPSRRKGDRGLAGRWGWNTQTVVARKEIRFYLRDPRQRLVWTGAVIFLGLAGASILVGSGGLSSFRTRDWLPLLAPGMVLFVGLPIALNAFGWERNAASFLFVLPVRPRRLVMGKNLAAASALVLETVLLSVILAWLSDSWSTLRLVPGLALCAIGCQLAVGNLVSVIAPLRLPREGTDVFSQATEQGCLAILAQISSFFVIGLLLVIPSSVTVLTIAFGAPISVWFANAFSIVWGLVVYLVSLWITGVVLKRRMPEIVNWVQVV